VREEGTDGSYSGSGAAGARIERWEEADLGTIEAEAQQVFRQLGGVLLGGLARARVAGQARERAVCPTCGGAVRLVEGGRPRVVQGLVGEVRVRRPYYHCAVCRVGTAPLDVAWGLGRGGLSPALTRVVCRAGIEGAFAQGADLVWEHLGVRVEAEVVRRATEAVGEVAEADQTDRTRWAVPAEQVPEILLVAVDGVLVHERTAWRECKIGRVGPLGPDQVVDRETGETHLALGSAGYTAGLEDADACWGRVMREARRQGWGRGVRTAVVLGDGADWIWRQARCQLGRPSVEVVEIVDFFHACEHLSTVAHAVWGGGDRRASDWLATQRHALRHQGSRPVRRALGKLRPRTATAADEVRKGRHYFRTHAARMHYPAFRTRQFPIGSGAIESTAKNLIQARQTLAGMRWSLPGAQAVASLRALHRSGRWATFWQSQPQCRLRLVPAGRAATAPEAAQPPGEDQPAACSLSSLAPPKETPPAATRIQTAGKPWWRSRAWGDSPIHRPRSA
jgi:hypothetical protein